MVILFCCGHQVCSGLASNDYQPVSNGSVPGYPSQGRPPLSPHLPAVLPALTHPHRPLRTQLSWKSLVLCEPRHLPTQISPHRGPSERVRAGHLIDSGSGLSGHARSPSHFPCLMSQGSQFL